ncbi:MAG: hypothetical protein KAJ00_01220, partial [Deltaproteobacteria bacterium]|nr:hypothetical protein [Deltaproteobacteria bacterium]
GWDLPGPFLFIQKYLHSPLFQAAHQTTADQHTDHQPLAPRDQTTYTLIYNYYIPGRLPEQKPPTTPLAYI